MKKLLVLPVLAGLMLAGIAGADTAETTISATVATLRVAISVTDGDIAYGLVTSSLEIIDTTPSDLNDSQSISNDGNSSISVDIKGFDTSSWVLDSSQHGSLANAYKHESSLDGGSTWSVFNLVYVPLNTMTPAEVAVSDYKFSAPLVLDNDSTDQEPDISLLATSI